ncbi:hypothetical protein P3T31_001940 [Rhizobium sp. AN70]|nr:hypothetical protein [Rhizobium sp. AN70]
MVPPLHNVLLRLRNGIKASERIQAATRISVGQSRGEKVPAQPLDTEKVQTEDGWGKELKAPKHCS